MSSEDYKAPVQNTRDKAIAEINALRLHPEFKVEQVTEYHFRINDIWDLYPTKRKIYKVGVTTNFAGWKQGDLLNKLRLILNRGSVTAKKFDLNYFSHSGKLIEVVVRKKDWKTCNAKQRILQSAGTHKMGVLKIVPHLTQQTEK